jgi:XTP/dITP diphosphohydrolase
VLTLAERGRARGVFSDFAAGELLAAPHGHQGFGYDPIFFFPLLGKSFAELPREEKNHYNHRAARPILSSCGVVRLGCCDAVRY